MMCAQIGAVLQQEHGVLKWYKRRGIPYLSALVFVSIAHPGSGFMSLPQGIVLSQGRPKWLINVIFISQLRMHFEML